MSQRIRAGTIASFRVGDIEYPAVGQVLEQAGPELTVRGTVMYLSDCGNQKSHFAVIEVHGIRTPVIVPVDQLNVRAPEPIEPRATDVPARLGVARAQPRDCIGQRGMNLDRWSSDSPFEKL